MVESEKTVVNSDEIKNAFDKNKIAQRYAGMGSRVVKFFHIGDKLELNLDEKKYVKILAGEEILKEQQAKIKEVKKELSTDQDYLNYKGAINPFLKAPFSKWIDLKIYKNHYQNQFKEEEELKGEFRSTAYFNWWKWLPFASSWAERKIESKQSSLQQAKEIFTRFKEQKHDELIVADGAARIYDIEAAVHNILSFGLLQGESKSRSVNATCISIPEEKIERWAVRWKDVLKKDTDESVQGKAIPEKEKFIFEA